MTRSSPGTVAESRLTTAGDLLRGSLWPLWRMLRLPMFMFLAILEPVVRFVLGALAPLGVLTALFLKFYAATLIRQMMVQAASIGRRHSEIN